MRNRHIWNRLDLVDFEHACALPAPVWQPRALHAAPPGYHTLFRVKSGSTLRAKETAPAVTVTTAKADAPLALVAEMNAVPGATAVTVPAATVATAVLLDVQV